MLIEDISVIETSRCLVEEGKFKAITMASASLTEVLPYLNAVLEKANYYHTAGSLVFKDGDIGFTLQKNKINVTRFANMTQLYECLDWIKDLINETSANRAQIKPDLSARKVLPALVIYKFLPQTNCRQCGQRTCLAFAAKLNKMEAGIDDCPPLARPENAALRTSLFDQMS